MNIANLTIPDEVLGRFCAKHRIRTLRLFGSALRDDFTDDSDIDLIVEFETGTRIGLFGFNALESALSELFGRRVDLNTPDSLSKYFRDEVLAEAETLYVAA